MSWLLSSDVDHRAAGDGVRAPDRGRAVRSREGQAVARRGRLSQGLRRDVKRREALLHKIQQLTIDRAMFIPVMDYRTLRGVGPRVAEHALDTLHLVPSPAHEAIKLKTP